MKVTFTLYINNVGFKVTSPKGFLLGSTIRQMARDQSLWHHNNSDDTFWQLLMDNRLIPFVDGMILWPDPMVDDYRFYTQTFLVYDQSYSPEPLPT